MRKLSECISEEKFMLGVAAAELALAPVVQNLCVPSKDLTDDQKFVCEVMVAVALSHSLGVILSGHFKPGDVDGFAYALQPVLGSITAVISDLHKQRLPTPEVMHNSPVGAGTVH